MEEWRGGGQGGKQEGGRGELRYRSSFVRKGHFGIHSYLAWNLVLITAQWEVEGTDIRTTSLLQDLCSRRLSVS